MQIRDYTFKVKALGDESSGTFTGLASPYGGPPDLVGDIISPGAYKQSIQQQGAGYPLLWAHKQDEPVGIAKVSDSPQGLVVDGQLLMTDVGAQRAYGFMKAGIVRGLSIGYQADPGKTTYNDDGTRTLREIRLFEISLVAVPCALAAQITSVKSLSQVECLLSGIKRGDVTGDAALAAQLRGIDLTLKSLLRKNTMCDCNCEECLDGHCEDCSDDECVDPNCEGSVKAGKAVEQLALLKSFDASLKTIVGGE
jgi:HK97 family phage prohead protease